MSLVLTFISLILLSCSSKESNEFNCAWDKELDSLYIRYKCIATPNCNTDVWDPIELFADISKERINCLLDSMIKKEEHLWMDVYLYATLPDSIFGVSQKAVDRIKMDPDSCLQEMWMLALSEHNVIDYKFKNVCHIKKYESKFPSASELDFYWSHEYDYEIGNQLDSLKRIAEKKTIEKSYKIGTCDGEIIDFLTEGLYVELETTKSCIVNRILYSYDIEKKNDTTTLKIAPPAQSIYDSTQEIIQIPMYSFEVDKSKVTKLRENHKQRIIVEWSSLSSFVSSNEKECNLNKNHIGKKIILVIPCFDEDWAMNFYPFHVNKTKYPFISCEITSTKEKL